MNTRFVATLCLSSLLASACSLHSPGLTEGNLTEAVIRQPKTTGSQENDVVYLLLSAEIAAQRSQFDVALTNYMKAAEISRDPKIAARATQIALYLKNSEKAAVAANLWQNLEPSNTDAIRIGAMLELQAGHLDSAVERIKFLLSRPDIDLENTLVDVVKLLETSASKEDGFSVFRRLIHSFPDMAELHFALALLASEKEEFQLALDETQAALALHPDWNRARLLQAQVMSRMGDSDAARQIIRRAVRAEPNNLRLRLIYSQFLAKSGNFKEAERELNQIIAKDPRNDDARFALGMAQMEMGQREKARQQFLKLTESPRWKMQSYFYLGLVDASKNRLSDALQWFDRVTEGPLAFDAQVNSITALINLGELSESRKRLGIVRAKFPNEALRLYLLEAELLSKNKDYAGAFDVLTGGLDQMPGQIELLYTRALIAERLDRIESLEADLRAVLDKDPDDPNALNALGYTLADRYPDRLQEAKKYLDHAMELKPGDPAILDSYGWLHYRMGDFKFALIYLRQAYRLVKDPEIGGHLGEVLWESGNQSEAKKVWTEAFKKNPDGEDAVRIRARYPEAFAR